jgi:RNA polymerase sigma-70 factor (ECF subfamily)
VENETVSMPEGVTVAERDDALMACLAARDAQALRTVISLYGEKAHRIAWRMLGDAMEAEDVAQEAMLKLWQQAGGWSAGGQGIGPWLARVTANLCIDRMRRIRPVTSEDLPERVDETPLADEQVDEAQIRSLMQAALQALPDRQRAAIVLTYWQECSNQEAALALEMNIKAFESLLLRARKALREAMIKRGLVGPEEAE